MPNSWTEPRTAPPTFLPAIAGGLVILLALPVFLIAGWPRQGLGDRRGCSGSARRPSARS